MSRFSQKIRVKLTLLKYVRVLRSAVPQRCRQTECQELLASAAIARPQFAFPCAPDQFPFGKCFAGGLKPAYSQTRSDLPCPSSRLERSCLGHRRRVGDHFEDPLGVIEYLQARQKGFDLHFRDGGHPTIYQAGISTLVESLKQVPVLSMAHATLSSRSATERRDRP